MAKLLEENVGLHGEIRLDILRYLKKKIALKSCYCPFRKNRSTRKSLL